MTENTGDKIEIGVQQTHPVVVTPITLYLIRHGTDITEFAERFGDDRLTTDGVAQAQQFASYLAGEKITRIYSSPNQPAMETAEIIAQQCDLEIKQDSRLAARALGEADGKSYHRVRLAYPHLLQKSTFDIDWKFPGGESNGDVFMRSLSFAKEMLEKSSGKIERIAVISHSMVLNYLLYNFQGIGFQNGLFYIMHGGCYAILKRSHRQFQLYEMGEI